ncbi:MAG: AAA family ATPase [Planctomycetota bacterium]
MPKKPLVLLVGGPNGSGKTSFARQALTTHDAEYLGADAIAAELAPKEPESAAIAAGREFVVRLNDRIEKKRSVIVESTLAGKSLLSYVQRATGRGYSTELNFVCLVSPDANVARVAHRVRMGGHHVPEEDVRRRYSRSMTNFWNDYRFAVDSWMLYDNSGGNYVEVAYGQADTYVATQRRLMDRFLAQVTG